MADDEGAEYWHSVYGQPVHTHGGIDGMGDEEYAAHVRARMWTKTDEGREAERLKRRAEARKEKDIEEQERRERRKRRRLEEEIGKELLDDDIARSLKSGERRKRLRQERMQWDDYIKSWKVWGGQVDEMAWPVEGRGQWGVRQVSEAAVWKFMHSGLDEEEERDRAEFTMRLREERVRWHPDKMQQRLGGKVDELVMRDVTAVFQIVDKFWGQARG